MSQPLRTSLAQITSSKHKRFDDGDVDVLWLCIVFLAIILLALVIWAVIWYNVCREDPDKQEDADDKSMQKEEPKKPEAEAEA